MAIQTLNTIKNWFKTSLKPSQQQFWDTWDSFRHKLEKIPVKEVEGIEELLNTKADKTALNNHLADVSAHAPQVNTDWNSQSGFSQLLNKPEFKTINGKSVLGDGDITIEEGGLQNLNQTLANGNETYHTALFRRGEDEDIYENTVGAKQIEIKHSNDYSPNRNEMVSLKSDLIEIAKLNTGETTALLAKGVGFGNSNTNNYSILEMNPATTANYSNVLMPPITEEGQTKTLATTNDFKTINGESILGEGDITFENTQSGTPNTISKFDSSGKKLENSNISDNGSHILISTSTEIDSQEEGKAGLKFSNLKNESTTISEIVFDKDVTVTAGIDETAYFPSGNIVKKVNLDKSITDYFSFPEGFYISRLIPSPTTGNLFLIYSDGTLYNLVRFDNTGILSVLKSSNNDFYYLAIDKNDSLYVQESNSTAIFKIDSLTLREDLYYNGNLSLYALGFDQELNGYFIEYNAANVIYKIDESGLITNFITLDFEVREGCLKDDGSLYVNSHNFEDKNIYLIDKNGTNAIVFTSGDYKLYEPCLSEDGHLYVHNHDYDNGLVYRVSPLGEISIFGSAGKSPRGMTVTKSGIVYTSNSGSYNLIKISLQEDIKLLTLDKDGNVILYDKEVVTKSELKTINGESIIGSGNIITRNEGNQDLDKTLINGNESSTSIKIKDKTYLGELSPGSLKLADVNSEIQISGHSLSFTNDAGNNTFTLLPENTITTNSTFYLPTNKISGNYTLATLDDIAGGEETPVSSTESGIVNNIALQELGGVDKTINQIRVGKGGGNIVNNTTLGYGALGANTTGNYNTAVGRGSQYTTTTGGYNTSLGSASLYFNLDGIRNTALGSYGLYRNTSGTYNVASGSQSLYYNTTGSFNTGLGAASLYANTTGSYNTGVGYGAIGTVYPTSVGGSSRNTAIGYRAGINIISANDNIFIGTDNTLPPTINKSLNYGDKNILIGKLDNSLNNGNNNTIFGWLELDSTLNNNIIIADGSGNIGLRKTDTNQLLAPTLTNSLIESGGAKSIITREYFEEKSQIKNKQIFVNEDVFVEENWNGHTIIFENSCIVSIPMLLTENFSFTGITLEGVNLTWQWANQVQWAFGIPEITPEKKYFNLTKIENTNQLILSL